MHVAVRPFVRRTTGGLFVRTTPSVAGLTPSQMVRLRLHYNEMALCPEFNDNNVKIHYDELLEYIAPGTDKMDHTAYVGRLCRAGTLDK